MENKSVRYTVRLTTEDAALLEERAKERGMKGSAYVRMLIRQKPEEYPEIRKSLNALVNEVNHIGVNVNQIVKNHNSKFYSDVEKERLVAYLRKLILSVNEVVKAVGNQ